LEQQARRCEDMVAKLQAEDVAFLAAVKEGAAATGAQSFKAKKLRSDYDRRLKVGECVRGAEQIIKRARLVIAELRKQQRSAEEAELAAKKARENSTKASKSNLDAGGIEAEDDGEKARARRRLEARRMQQMLDEEQQTQVLEHKMMQQQSYALREYNEQASTQSEQTALREVARSARMVEEMATEVGSLLEVQTDDVNRLEANTDDSVARTMEGVHELSRARKKQASTGTIKATFGTATVGTLVGIVGGPVGMVIGAAAGGVVGMVAGKGVAAVKRRSINAETRRIKALLSARKQRTGEFTLQVYAYEVQQWSYMLRKWVQSERVWADEFGEPIRGAHPEKETSAAEARLQLLAEARSDSNNLTPEEEAEIEAVHERELEYDVSWHWASSKWDVVMDRPNTDLGGWDFASKMTSDTWYAEAKRSCVVRRRLWVRYLTGKPGTSPAHREAAEKLLRARQLQESMDGNAAFTDSDRETQNLWNGIYRNSVTTNTLLNESLNRATEQGEQISRAERNAAIVGDAATFTDRINRASRLSGAMRNFVTWQRGELQHVDAATREEILRRERAMQKAEARAAQQRAAASANPINLEDEAASNFSENLYIAERMSSELDAQNKQLDRTVDAIERGNASVLKITRKLKS